jgi:hypothetical protein
MIARHATRASHLPDRLHAAPPLTREELRRLDWDYERALKASRRRGIALSLLVVLGALAALAALVWP